MIRHEIAQATDEAITCGAQRHALHSDRARSTRAATHFDQITITLHDLNRLKRKARLIMDKLRIDRFVALPV